MFLRDEAMQLLEDMTNAVEFCAADDGRMLLAVLDERELRGFVSKEVDPAAFDALVERGWVELRGENEVHVSESGYYWLARWVKARTKRRRTA